MGKSSVVPTSFAAPAFLAVLAGAAILFVTLSRTPAVDPGAHATAPPLVVLRDQATDKPTIATSNEGTHQRPLEIALRSISLEATGRAVAVLHVDGQILIVRGGEGIDGDTTVYRVGENVVELATRQGLLRLSLHGAVVPPDAPPAADTTFLGLGLVSNGYLVGTSPSAELLSAGLRPGDLVVGVNGANFSNPVSDLTTFYEKSTRGIASLQVLRDGTLLSVQLPTGE